jgi:hypothetical protein
MNRKMISMLSTLACAALFFLSACGAVEGGAKMCTQDSDCSSGFSCKPGAKYKTCQPNSGGEIECRIASDCALDGSMACTGGKCVQNLSPMCKITSDCSADGSKVCINGMCSNNTTSHGTGTTCKVITDCDAGLTCRMGKCALPDCTIDGCTAPSTCNTTTKWCESPIATKYYTVVLTCTSSLPSAHMYVEGMACKGKDYAINCATYSGVDWNRWKELGTTTGAGPHTSVTATIQVPEGYEPRFDAYAQDYTDGAIVRYAGAKSTAGRAYDPTFVCTAKVEVVNKSIYRVIDGNSRGGDLLQVQNY